MSAVDPETREINELQPASPSQPTYSMVSLGYSGSADGRDHRVQSSGFSSGRTAMLCAASSIHHSPLSHKLPPTPAAAADCSPVNATKDAHGSEAVQYYGNSCSRANVLKGS